MEKRWCKRVPVSIDVMLHHHGQKLAKCAVKDISLCGIRLHSGPLALYRNTPIRIQFLGESAREEGHSLINAIVVRNAIDEIGLAFDPTEPEMLRAIIKHYKQSDYLPLNQSGHG